MANTKRDTANRPERVPVHERNRVTFQDQDPDYVYRFVNDVEDRIQQFLNAGYEVVNSNSAVGDKVVDDPSKLSTAVTKSVGGGIIAYLMRISRDWYEADQRKKISALEEQEASFHQEHRGQHAFKFSIERK